jgi:D-glycero-alpha-D-manno-heptose-7-phosphate kinase
MIITRTPFRISFFGGGTDFPAWYKRNGGAVLSATIDKYCYITCRLLPPFFEHKHRIVYSRSELSNNIGEILHPSVRETFRFMNVQEGLEVHHDGDLPARSGLGSSSAFTVGLLHALYGLKGQLASKRRLYLDAIYIEQEMIKENVGSQDQVAVAFGGLNKITFLGDHEIDISPVVLSKSRTQEFEEHLMLFFTGFSRYASDIEAGKMKVLDKKANELSAMGRMVDDAISILGDNGSLLDFGRLLHETWCLKKTLSPEVSTNAIDEIYETALRNGAVGGKLLGAGGGGFMLFVVPPEGRAGLRQALGSLLHVPFRFERSGSQIIYYYDEEDRGR